MFNLSLKSRGDRAGCNRSRLLQGQLRVYFLRNQVETITLDTSGRCETFQRGIDILNTLSEKLQTISCLVTKVAFLNSIFCYSLLNIAGYCFYYESNAYFLIFTVISVLKWSI